MSEASAGSGAELAEGLQSIPVCWNRSTAGVGAAEGI